ncbi:MAG TPA: hypothetical protein VEH62_00585 [Gemmatimonadales bacterium]|nr:hypothetical protein [Gemmatimonadales bacterium]
MTPVPTTLRLRVTVADAWQVCALEARANEKIAAVKQRSLAAAHIGAGRAPEYVVKFGGALVANEASSLADLSVPDGAALVVLPARRRAVR